MNFLLEMFYQRDFSSLLVCDKQKTLSAEQYFFDENNVEFETNVDGGKRISLEMKKGDSGEVSKVLNFQICTNFGNYSMMKVFASCPLDSKQGMRYSVFLHVLDDVSNYVLACEYSDQKRGVIDFKKSWIFLYQDQRKYLIDAQLAKRSDVPHEINVVETVEAFVAQVQCEDYRRRPLLFGVRR